jgi:hypothetical protein
MMCHNTVESYRLNAFEDGHLVHDTAVPADEKVLRRNVWVLLDDFGLVVPHTPNLEMAE